MIERSIKALMFADIKGFSKMNERECFAFCSHFHRGVQENVLSRYDDRILLKNTWGDALHVVMDDIEAAGEMALELRDWMQSFPWVEHGLREPPKIRIGLHAGVVSKVPDPITGKCNYVGTNTSRAARIEPISFEGQVFVSRAYAALLTVLRPKDLCCEYVGLRELPKNYGSLAVYLLRRTRRA